MLSEPGFPQNPRFLYKNDNKGLGRVFDLPGDQPYPCRMSIELLPYFLLLLAIIIGWRSTIKNSMVVFFAAVVSGLLLQRLEITALISIIALGLSIWLPAKLRLKGPWRMLSFAVFVLLAITMSNHLAPGFNNLAIFRNIQFSLDSVPFTMYLNFDKALVGLFIYLFFLKSNQTRSFKTKHLVTSLRVLCLLLMLIIPAAFIIRYVRVDLKLPELFWIWMLNNLFFVCLAEEAFFRGFIQKGLTNILPKVKICSVVSVMMAAVLFGLAHYKGGIGYVTLATIAGLFYGYAYQKTGRLESSIIVHFGLNVVHFLFFSYPAMVR